MQLRRQLPVRLAEVFQGLDPQLHLRTCVSTRRATVRRGTAHDGGKTQSALDWKIKEDAQRHTRRRSLLPKRRTADRSTHTNYNEMYSQHPKANLFAHTTHTFPMDPHRSRRSQLIGSQ